MDREATEKLKLDQRLIRRRSWLSREELARALEKLPDVGHKIAPREELEAPRQADPGESPEGSDVPPSNAP